MDTSDFPRNFIEFEERFATEASCLAYVWPGGVPLLEMRGARIVAGARAPRR